MTDAESERCGRAFPDGPIFRCTREEGHAGAHYHDVLGGRR